MVLKSFKVVQDLQEAGTQSANGIGQPGGDSLYYSCQRQPRSLFLEQQIRAFLGHVPGCVRVFYSTQGSSSRCNLQQPTASLYSHGLGFPSGLWLLAFGAT